MRRKLALLAGLVFVFVVGFFIGVWVTGRGYEKFVIDPVRYEKANLAAIRVNILSLLRVGAAEEAIKTLEMMLDNETLVLTQRTNDPEQLPKDVVRALKQIKTYREIYPPDENTAPRIAQALAKVPKVTDYKKECQGGICRLLEFKKQEAQESAVMDKATQP
ncbi:MAG TPA: hypothetical protein VM492_04220 [Sumerlaeia bacterium]|nr:hypothetical protein [Sumerlaeia bacterium]